MAKYVPDLLTDFLDSWLALPGDKKMRAQNQKYKDYNSMKVLIKNLTSFSLYLKTKQNKNKIYLTQIFVKKLNNYLAERRKQYESKSAINDFFYYGLLIPFGLNNNKDKSILVSS